MFLQIKDLSFSYTDATWVFQNFNWEIPQGKIIAIAGESGCGKSTLLGLIYGLWDWQQGDIYFEGRSLFGPKANIVPGEPQMKLVAQDYDLMPYATVYDNVGQYISNINLAEKRSRVHTLLEMVGMEDYALQQPKYLSGGQQQRVAIARALSVHPKLLLLDEPFSNLDRSRAMQLRDKLFSYTRQENLTILISTHSLPELMPWLDEILILKEGEIVQYDTPQQVYHHPKNAYVARLFGEVNVLSAGDQKSLALPKRFYYPTEIKQYSEGILARVLESRFSGSYYWNKIKVKNTTLLMYTERYVEGEIHIAF